MLPLDTLDVNSAICIKGSNRIKAVISEKGGPINYWDTLSSVRQTFWLGSIFEWINYLIHVCDVIYRDYYNLLYEVKSEIALF